MPNGPVCEFLPHDKRKAARRPLIVPLCSRPQPPMEAVAKVDELCAGAASALLRAAPLRDDVGSLTHTAAEAGRVVLVSLGDAARIDAARVRAAAAAAARWIVGEKLDAAAVWVDGLLATPVDRVLGEWALGMSLGTFRFTELRSENHAGPERVAVSLLSSAAQHVAARAAEVRASDTLAEAVNFARALAHRPANVINPDSLAAAARRMCAGTRLKCGVLGSDELKQLGMNGLLAVGRSALHPPCLIQVEYRPLPRRNPTVVLVGKAVTFDTGGYSIKPAAGMEAMKFDKCGGTAVLGTMKAVEALKLRCNVVGLVAAAENAISERAYRPGDIIRMMSGKTVEIISTDAEGRMLLGDALWYAQERLKPTYLIDLATLTGGVGVALGKAAAGLMSNDDALAGDLEEAGRRTHERLWRLPLWDDYRELIKGTDSDIRNSSGQRDAHAIAGGMFLKEFVRDGTAWAHLDIASVASQEGNDSPTGKGATGFGIRLLVEFLRARLGG